MKQHWQQAGHKVKPGLKIAGKLVLLTALRFGPAGVAGWAIKSVARKPIRMVLAVALEPLLQKVAFSPLLIPIIPAGVSPFPDGGGTGDG